MIDIMEQIGLPALCENAAEECTEAAQAFLKWARILRGENPTDKSLGDAVTEVHEEVADVMNMIDVIRNRGLLDMDDIEQMRMRKMGRWRKRLEGIPYRKPEILPGPPKDKEAQV